MMAKLLASLQESLLEFQLPHLKINQIVVFHQELFDPQLLSQGISSLYLKVVRNNEMEVVLGLLKESINKSLSHSYPQKEVENCTFHKL